MFHGGVKHCTEVLKYSTEVSNIPRRCPMVHGGGQMFHGGMNYSTGPLKYSTEVSDVPWRYEIFRGGV